MAHRPTPSTLLRTAAMRWWQRLNDEPRRALAITIAAVLTTGLIALDGGIDDRPDDRASGLAPVTYVEESATGCADDVWRWMQSPDTDTVMYEVGTTSPKFTAFVQVNSMFQANAVQYGVSRASEMAAVDITERCTAAYPAYSAPRATPSSTRAATTHETSAVGGLDCPTEDCATFDDLSPAEQAKILAELQGPQPPDVAACETAGRALTSGLSNAEAYPLLREHGCGYWLDSYAG